MRPAAHSERMTVARNAATSYGVRVARGVSLLLLTPFLYRQLGAGGFGTWSVMFVITTVLSLLEIGFSAGARKYVAELHASGRRRELETTIHAAVVLMAVLGAVSAALCAAVGVFGSGIAGDGLEGAFRTGMLVLAAAALLRLPWVAYGSALLGYQRWDLWNLAELVNIVGFALGAVVALTAGAGLVGLSVAYGCAAVLSAVLMPLMLRRVRQPGQVVGVRRRTGSVRSVLSR